MDRKELIDAVTAAASRRDDAYVSPSGPFLDLLRRLAHDKDVEAIAEANKLYVQHHPEADHFIAASLPAILHNHFFPNCSDVNYDKFIEWTVKNTNTWGQGVIENFDSPSGLDIAIRVIIQSVSF